MQVLADSLHLPFADKSVDVCLLNFLKDDANIHAIQRAAVLLADSFKAGGKVLSCGNGGSHCDAM
ncbi:SIS domain-containing protein, partial [Salmonella enterica subsp. enterica serovar Kentucky]|nr:SIS domain-containing protein [Salmonella enterica subsp. enterica serovar Kentucky]